MSSILETKFKHKDFISFKKPATIAKSNEIKNNIIQKVKNSKLRTRPKTRTQKQLEAAAAKINNSILNYALPKTVDQPEKLSPDMGFSTVEKEV